jgi:hypothetical protein
VQRKVHRYAAGVTTDGDHVLMRVGSMRDGLLRDVSRSS